MQLFIRSFFTTAILIFFGCLFDDAKKSEPQNLPILTSVSDTAAGEGDYLSFVVSAISPVGDSVTLEALNLPEGATFKTGTLTWFPNFLSAGSNVIQFTAKTNTVQTTLSITVMITDKPISYSTQVQPIFDGQCVECHNLQGGGYTLTGGATMQGLDLSQGKSWALLTNVASFQAPALSPKLRVLPGDTAESYLVQKVDPDIRPKVGEIMPFGGFGGVVEPFNRAVIKAWILEGALNN